MAIHTHLARPRGTVALEDPDWGSWHFNPPAAACDELIATIRQAFRQWGDPDAGRRQLELLRGEGIDGHVRAEVLALPPGHPYLRLPLQMATALTARLRQLMSSEELERLMNEAEAELAQPGRWGTTFTLIQAWGQRPA